MWDRQFEESLRRFLPYLSADEPLEEDAQLRDYGLDSLAGVELLSLLEHTYSVRFTDETLSLETFKTPGTVWNALSMIRVPAN